MTTTPETTPKPKRFRKTLLGLAGATLFFVGIGVGGAGSTPAAPAAMPAPTMTATVTESVSVPETPQVCLDALDRGDEMLDIASEGFGFAQQALEGAGEFDVAKINKATAGLQKLTPKTEKARAAWDDASASCRAA